MRAIVIDTVRKEVYEIDLPSGDGFLDAAYQVMSCHCIAMAAELVNGDTVFVDDEGLLHSPIPEGFKISGPDLCYPVQDEFAGIGLVVGHDGEGETIAAKSTLEEIKAMVRF